MSKWIFNDCELEYDFDDLIAMNKYEEASKYAVREFTDFSKKTEKESVSRAEEIQFYYDTISKYFEMLFDKSVVVKLFDGTINRRTCTEAFESFVAFAIKSIQENDNHIKQLSSRYSGKRPTNNNKPYYTNRNKKKKRS